MLSNTLFYNICMVLMAALLHISHVPSARPFCDVPSYALFHVRFLALCRYLLTLHGDSVESCNNEML